MNLRKPIRTICKHPGCAHPVQARSMCNTHYQKWRRASPQALIRESTEAMILKAMPGTRHEIEIRTGFVLQTVLKHLKRLRNEGKAYIAGKKEPGESGAKWLPVYAAGQRPDVVISEEVMRKRRNEQQNRRNREAASRRRQRAEELEQARPGLMFADPFNLINRHHGA